MSMIQASSRLGITLVDLPAQALRYRAGMTAQPIAPPHIYDAGFLPGLEHRLEAAAWLDASSRALVNERVAAGASVADVADLVHFGNTLGSVGWDFQRGALSLWGAKRLFTPLQVAGKRAAANVVSDYDASLQRKLLHEIALYHPLASLVLEGPVCGRRQGPEGIEGDFGWLGLRCCHSKRSGLDHVVRYPSFTLLSLLGNLGYGGLGTWGFAVAPGLVSNATILEWMVKGIRVIGIPLSDMPDSKSPLNFTYHDFEHLHGGMKETPRWLFQCGARCVQELRRVQSALVDTARAAAFARAVDHTESIVADMERATPSAICSASERALEELFYCAPRDLFRGVLAGYQRSVEVVTGQQFSQLARSPHFPLAFIGSYLCYL